MKYSIVIPSVDNFKYLSQCLLSIQNNSGTTDYEVIVVDNGSRDMITLELFKLLVAVDLIKDDSGIPLGFKRDFLKRCKVIRNEQNEGFGRATNQGMAASSGDYIVWLNDDTLVSKNWLDKMAANIEYQDNDYHPNIGITGPMSNNAMGKQSEGLTNVTPDQMDMVMEKFVTTIKEGIKSFGPGGKFVPLLTSAVSGFCLMMRRKVYETIGGIDDLYSPGGFCDNDYCIRAIEAGYGVAYDPYTFIYHYGHTTLDKIENSHRGLANWAKYIKKWQDIRKEEPKKLLAVQRVKLDTEKAVELYKECSARNNPYVDGVIVLSDRSEAFNYEKAKEIWGNKLVRFFLNKEKDGFDEHRDRMQILEAAYDLRSTYDWCIVLDHDECFPPETRVERVQELMNPLNPAVFAYTFYLKNYWESKDYIRLDDNWGRTYVRRMYKNIFPPALREKLGPEDKGLHCGNVPITIPLNATRVCNITLDHYGYIDREEINRKYEFYTKMDTTDIVTRKVLVHEAGDYDFFIENKVMSLVKPKPFSISANIMTMNEEVSIGVTLLTYFALVDEFVIVDTGSTDNTVKWLKYVGIPVYEAPLEKNFAKVRNKCIELSKYKYCMQVDPDERPYNDIEQSVVASLIKDPDVVIWHLENTQKNGHVAVTKQPRIFRRNERIYFSGRVHEVLDKSLSKIPNLRFDDPGLRSVNTGFLTDDAAIKKKLAFYAELLELEIQDNPDNYLAHFELALHHRNYDRTDKAVEYLEKAHKLNPKYVPAIRERALIHVQEAYEKLKLCQGIPMDEVMVQSLHELERALRPIAQARIRVGQ